jgi:sarcosine oxidase
LNRAANGRTTFDAIVIGVGSMGSAACYFLSQRGYRVLGFEQFHIPHEWGSHFGQTRIIRKAYAEHTDYVPLLERAYQNWRNLERQTGSKVFYRTGLVYFGRPADRFMKGIHDSANKHHVEVRSLSESETAHKYPQFRLPSDYERLEEPDAGFVVPERCILLFAEQAIRGGATILTGTKVFDWQRDRSGVRVSTSKGEFYGKKLVITAGPWAATLVSRMSSRLRVTRQVTAWVIPKNWEPFQLDRFPCWIVDEYYGFPVLPVGGFGGPIGLKVAKHHPGGVVDPNDIDRVPTADDQQDLVDALNRFIPDGYAETHAIKICMYTNSPDGHFIVDYVPGFEDDVVIATGFSGHGFKFASVIGEVVADLAMSGGTALPIGFLSAGRFS